MMGKIELGTTPEQRCEFTRELERVASEMGQPLENGDDSGLPESTRMTDDEIMEAAAKITASRGANAESIRAAEKELERKAADRKIKDERERRDSLLRDYAEKNLRGWGLIDYAIFNHQIIAFMKAGEDRFTIEVCGFNDKHNIVGLYEVPLDLEAAKTITKVMRLALEL